jgi:hypothetical protein
VRRFAVKKFVLSLVAAVGVPMALCAAAGASTVSEAQYGFTFSLPSNWTQIPLDSKDIGAIIGAAAKGDPALENVLDQQAVAATKKGLKVFAVGPISGGFFPNLNVGVTSATGMPTGSAFVNLMMAEVKITLTEAGATHVSTAPAHLPLGPAVQAGYQLKLAVTTHPVLVHGLQFYVEHGARLYVLTFSGTTPAEYQPVAHDVVTSWHWQG